MKFPYKAATLAQTRKWKPGRVTEERPRITESCHRHGQLAMEDEESSIPALREAARLSDEGELNLRLGNAHLNLGQYAECVSSNPAMALRKGGIKSPDNAQISHWHVSI